MRNPSGWLLAMATFAPAVLCAQPLPFGPEFRVNTYTTGNQSGPLVAADRAGNFVVVWTSNAQDGSGSGIFGQRFDSSGAKTGPEFQINTYTTGRQVVPSVAADKAGNFIVVWQNNAQDGSEIGIFGQRFNSSGAKVGPEFQVNTYTTGGRYNNSVAADSAGNFVVVWQSEGQDGSGYGVFGQRFNSSGAKVGPEFQVNTYTTGFQVVPSVAADTAGNFVVVWQSSGQDGSDYGVFGQRFNSSGAKTGPEFQINTYTTGFQDLPSVAADSAGNFIVVWTSDAQDGSGSGVFGQRFNSSGAKAGPEFQVNTYTTSDQDSFSSSSISSDSAGNFVVVWRSSGQDGSNYGVFGQRLDRVGNRVGSEFQINTYTTLSQRFPSVASDGRGFVVAWTSDAQDGSGTGIFGRRQNLLAQPMAVDAHSSAATSSDANGMLEPGEQVLVEPAWGNVSVGSILLTGSLSSFTGPAGGIYLINDTSAGYGFIPVRGIHDCNDGSANACYAVTMGGTRPATHWDGIVQEDLSTGGSQFWTLHIGDSFSDVPRTELFYNKIETIFHAGITAGCSPTKYCPGDAVGRDQMSIFIAKGIAGSGDGVPSSGTALSASYACSPGGNSLFLDVSPTDAFCKHVHYIAAQNVTLGCAVLMYCPGGAVTRDAMASFIAKAIVAPQGGAGVPVTFSQSGRSYSCDPASPDLHFTDVPVTNPFCKHIHFLWAKGIVSGCSATMYCPGLPVSRDAMAKFIANAFGLQLYGP